MKRRSRNRVASRFLALLVGGAFFVAPASAAEQVKFVAAVPDQEYRDADAKLIALLQRGSGFTFDRRFVESNSDAVARVLDLNRTRTGYVARLTPFACVAAEMLGADFDIIGTYQSKATNAETYHAYFVVNRERFRNTMRANSTDASPPRLFDIPDYLKKLQAAGKPRLFVFHDQFSTASYFLPALWFRNRRIFAMDQPIESLIPISVKKIPTSSGTPLVQAVANDEAALAAVGDVAKARFDDTPELKAAGSLVYFIQHPSVLPNDLLVASHSLGQPAIERIHAAIRAARKQDERIDVGDFLWWDDIRDANEASAALWTLRRQAAAAPAPVPIRVEDAADPRLQELVEASRQAIRLAGTEFVVFDPDFHKTADVVWKLTMLHDGAVLLRSSIDLPPDVAPQEFTISFSSPEDLTARISALIHNRMNRIRYIWPYRDDATILRDVAFGLPRASSLKISRITWVDPSRNDFNEGGTLDAQVVDSDFYKFTLKPATTLQFDPLSNAAYRTVLVRPPLASAWLKMFSFAFVALLLLALAWTVWALYRKTPQPRALTPAAERRAG
jgi:ABC-type phosphate/phosphonate transport system substrate-binding protein